jgi:hypothetical protein
VVTPEQVTPTAGAEQVAESDAAVPVAAPRPSQMSVAEPPEAELPEAELPEAELPEAELPAVETTGVPSGSPIKMTLYVDPEADEFMEAARVQGLTARPKVDISRSAVVRLAMRRLMEEMTPGEVKVLLEGQQVTSGPGRKRR